MKTAMASTLGPPRTPALSSISSLTRQSSIYTLTLEEFRNTVNEPGKNLGSMNMEDFLKNIWTVEESQAMAAAMSSVAEANVSSLNGSSQSLQRQGSLVPLPANLAGKTVEEVWSEIQRSNNHIAAGNIQERQVTMAEITLEDFLAKAGVVREEGETEAEAEPSANSSSSSVVTVSVGAIANKLPSEQKQTLIDHKVTQAMTQQVDWLNYQLGNNMPHQQLLHQQHQQLLQQHQHQQQQQAEAAAATAFTGRLAASVPVSVPVAAPAANIMEVPFDTSMGLGGPGSLSLSSVVTSSLDRKRPFEVEGKCIEQRQKRMIKNRESAARSRARKQAYTVELEEEVTQLKEENARLLQQQIEASNRRREELLQTLVPVTVAEAGRPGRVLRRTRTTSWIVLWESQTMD